MEGRVEPVMRCAIFTTLCSAYWRWAVTIAHCDTVGQYALDGAAVEVHQDLRRQLGLF